MRKQNKKRSARRRKIALGAFAGFMVFVSVRFFAMRATDRNAWPAGAPGVSLGIESFVATGLLASPADVAEVMAGFVAADAALINEYRLYQTLGVEAGRAYPLIAARLVDDGARFDSILGFWQRFDGFDPKSGSMPYNAFVGVNVEHALLTCYAAHAGGVVGQLPADKAEARLAALLNAVKLTNGGGILGRYAALNSSMLVVREIIMDPMVFADVAAVTSYVSRVRACELKIGDLGEALRMDLISLHEAIAVIYGKAMFSAEPVVVGASRRVGRVGATVIQMLGANFDDTCANIDALFSRLIRNASFPYSEEGLGKGLPAWCRGEGRTPSTRDPVGAAVAGAYMKHAVFAPAVQPSLVLELRAARIAVALACYEQWEGEVPDSLGELVAMGLLENRDLIDPFASDGTSRLSYARDGEGWRFYSVGLDQVDGGGLVDAYRSLDSGNQKQTDFAFVSCERERRLATRPATESVKTATGDEAEAKKED